MTEESQEIIPAEETVPVVVLPARTGRRSNALVGGVGVAALLVGVGAIPRITQHQKLTAEARAATNTAPFVNIVRPTLETGAVGIPLPGNVQAVAETAINARAAGFVRRWYADIGTRVKAGQVLAEIESPDTDQQLRGAQADMEKSRATWGQSQADVARLQAGQAQAGAAAAAAQANVEQIRADLVRLKAKELQARAAVSAATAKLAQASKAHEGRQADLARTKVAEELSRKTLGRWKELGKVNAVAGQEVDERQAAFDTASANVNVAQAAVEQASDEMDAARNQLAAANAEAQAAAADVDAGRQRIVAAQANVQAARAAMVAARAGVQAGREGVAAAQATVGSNAANVERYATLQRFQRVTAPFDGVITARNIDVGTLVNGGAPSGASETDPTRTVPRTGLFGIARTDTLRLQVNVPQSMIASLHPGQSAEVTLDEYPDRRYAGKVFTLGGALDAGSRTMLVEVRVPNPQGELIPGMYAQVRFVGLQTHPTVSIPANALIEDAEGVRVALVTPARRIHFVPVRVGRDLGKTVEIAAGLTGKETHVADPSDDLTEGGSVQVAPAPGNGIEAPQKRVASATGGQQ